MEITSTVNERWKLCTFASFMGCFILLLCLNQNQSAVNNDTSPSMSNVEFSNPSIFILNGKAVNQKNNDTSSMSNVELSKPSKFIENEPMKKKKDDSLSMSSKPSRFIENKKPTMNQTTFLKKAMNQTTKVKCNIFHGKWVYNPTLNPLYDESRCPFLSDQVSCKRNGRTDLRYQNWFWEANDCEIPRFNGIDMLERLRGKRVIIVGDSLNRNQWESLACLLYSAIPLSRANVNFRNGAYKVFKSKDYNCSVEFYWSPFLVQLHTKKGNGTKVLSLDTVDASAQRWHGADIMVFNTGHWWAHQGKFRAWDLYQYEGNYVEEMEIEVAFEMAMKTWAHWVDQNVDSTKTTVAFRSISPEHKGKQWCYNVTEPMMDESYLPSFPKPVRETVERVIGEMKTPVRYLNITKLSQYRRDAHPTVYATKDGKQRPAPMADCSHWCLPGLPDTWNSLLYAFMVFDTSGDTAPFSHLVV